MVVMLIDKDIIRKLVHPTILSWLIKEGRVVVLESQTCIHTKVTFVEQSLQTDVNYLEFNWC